MISPFAIADWIVMAGYVALLFFSGWWFAPRGMSDTRGYFLADGQLPVWLAAISVLTATQSAATFLGGPDYGYRGDLTYLGSSLGALIGAVIVARLLIPRFYAAGVSTVYELLEQRFGAAASKAAGILFLVGRILAAGARVYLAAIAVSMVIFATVNAHDVILSALLIVVASFAFTVFGGLRSVVWNDLIQFVLFIGAAIGVLIYLRLAIPLSTPQILDALRHAPGGQDKLRLIDWSWDTTHAFSLPAVITGVALLYVGNSGLDQDTTQRLLACRDAKAGAKSLYWSVAATLPVTFLFIAIGLLLSIHYNRPDLVGANGRQVASSFGGQQITVFMHYILTELPPGLRGLTTVGVIAAAVATTNSALNAMASVLVQDIYRPWRMQRGGASERHFVSAGRAAMAVTGAATFGTAALSYYWQQSTSMPLLEFALSVMTFAYAGLLGVYFTATLTPRGNSASAIVALIAGFVVILVLQPYIASALGLPDALRHLAFPWQLCIGTICATFICLAGAPVAPQPVLRGHYVDRDR